MCLIITAVLFSLCRIEKWKTENADLTLFQVINSAIAAHAQAQDLLTDWLPVGSSDYSISTVCSLYQMVMLQTVYQSKTNANDN